MARIGELTIAIDGDNTGLDRSINDSKSALDGLGTVIAGATAAVAAMGVAMFGAANKTAAATDRVDKLSQQLGLSRQGFQEWEFVLSQAGVSIDSMRVGMRTLSQRMQEAAEGAGTGAELFDRLGVAIDENTSQEDAFNATIEALQNMEAGIEQAALAQELFGRNGQDLIPLLNTTAESTEELKNKAQELGLVMSNEAIDAGVMFTDTMDQLKRMFSGVFNVVGAELLPIFQTLGNWVIDNMPTISAITEEVFSVISTVVTTVVGVFNDLLMPVFIMLYDWVQENLPTIQEFFNTVFTTIQTIISDFVIIITELWAIFGDDILNIMTIAFNAVKSVIETTLAFIQGVVSVFKALITGDWELLKESLIDTWEALWATVVTVIVTVLEGVVALIQTQAEVMKSVFDTLKTAIITLWNNMWSNVQESLTTAWNNIRISIETLYNSILNTFNTLKTNILNTWNTMWSNIDQAVQSAWNVLTGSFENLYSNISEWFTGVASDAITWGRELINGFRSGVQEMANSFKTYIKDFIQTNIVDNVKGVLGIASPSRVGAEIGGFFVEGIDNGLEENKATLVTTIQGIGASMVQAAEQAVADVNAVFSNISTTTTVSPGGGGGGGGGGSSDGPARGVGLRGDTGGGYGYDPVTEQWVSTNNRELAETLLDRPGGETLLQKRNREIREARERRAEERNRERYRQPGDVSAEEAGGIEELERIIADDIAGSRSTSNVVVNNFYSPKALDQKTIIKEVDRTNRELAFGL